MDTTRKKKPTSRRRRDRGVALIIAVISITMLTVVATEFAYNQRVDLQIAANGRDEIRAYYLARSGIGMSRLLLRFQRQLDTMLGQASQTLGGALGGGAMPSLNIQLWRMAKVDCHMLAGLVSQPGAGDPRDERPSGGSRRNEFDEEFPDLANAQSTRNFGGFEGCFDVQISDEEERINVNRLRAGGLSAYPVILGLYELMNDKKFEFLFDRMDANKVQVDPQDVIIAMADWVDEDETQSALDLTPGSPNPMVPGFAPENSNYDRYDPRYQAKNARFDTLDELYRVHGVSDAFMAAFRDRLTVYPDVNAKVNVNTTDPMMMTVLIRMVAANKADPRLQDPVFMAAVLEQIQTMRMFSFMGMSVQDFLSIVQAAGIPVDPSITVNLTANNYISDKSTTYRIVSVGEAGAVQKTITTVIRLDDGLGRLVYWREE